VKPDELGSHLEAFAKNLPTLRTLRLCHRFGKGPKVHITKLPVELELAIEEHVLDSSYYWTQFCWHDWTKEFSCFESRCRPSGHLEESPSPILDDAYGLVEECANCEEGGVWDGKCESIC